MSIRFYNKDVAIPLKDYIVSLNYFFNAVDIEICSKDNNNVYTTDHNDTT